MDVRQLKILAIDDNADNLTSLQAVLKDALPGCALFTALNGPDGIVLAHAEDPDVILLDIVMPGMDGYAVCQALKGDDRSRTIPVVFLTALRTDRASRSKAMDVGADGFLAKPLDEHELIAQIRTMAKLKVANRLQRLEREQLAALVVERTAQLESATVALRASEARYRSVFTESRVVKLLIDPADGRIVEGNRAACEYYGWDQAQLQAMCIQDINSLSADEVLAELERARTLRNTHFDFRHRLATGDVRDVEVYSSPLPAAEPGGRVLLHSIVLDVTDRRRVAEALHQSERGLLDAERVAHVGHWTWDTPSGTVSWSDEMKRIWARDPSDFGGDLEQIIPLAIHPDDQERVIASNRTVVLEQRPAPLEYRIIRPDGTERTVRAIPGDTRKAADGTILQLSGIVQDITEQVQAESARQAGEALLQASEEALRRAQRMAKIGHWTFDLGTGTSTWSEELFRIFGLEDGSRIPDAAGYAQFIHPDDAYFGTPECLAECLPRDHYELEYRIIDQTTRAIKHIHLWADTSRNALGEVVRLTGAIQDITERKRAEAMLRDEQERMRTVLDTVGDPIFVKDNEHRVILANRAFHGIFGLEDDAVIGRTLAEHVSPDERQQFLAVDRQVLDTGIPDLREEPMTVNGVTRTIVTRKARFLESTGERFLVGSIQDITERKRTEDQLAQSHALLVNLARLVPSAIYQYRLYPDGHSAFPYANAGITTIYEVTPEEVRDDATPVFGRLHPEDAERVGRLIMDSARTLEEFYCEYRVVLPRQGLRWRWSQAHPERTDDGGTLWHGIITDITERKQAEDQLRASEARLADAQKSAGIGSWETDLVDFSVFWSDETHRIFGVERESYQASHPAFLSFVHPDDRATVDAAFVGSLATRARHVIDHRIVTPEGLVKFVEERWRVEVDELERPVRAVGTCQDITDRKQAEAAHAALQEQLMQAQRMESIGLLAGGVAHDFNNQLAVIIGYTELTMLKLGSEHELHADVEEIHRAAQHSADLTRQLLAYARKQTLSPRVLDLNDAIDSMLKMLRRLLGERVTLVWTPESALWKVAVDPTQIDQVLANLAVNAKSAMRDGDAVLEVSTTNVVLDAAFATEHRGSPVGEFVCVRVRDNGAGMDAATCSRIFEPFFTTKGLGEGTGLGLSTVQGIVAQHGGYVHVDSTVGIGTTFDLYFPRSRSPAEIVRGPAAAPGRGTETILLVEDEEGVRFAATEMLRMMGYTVLAAQNGEEAETLSGSHAGGISLLLTDVIMPGLNGVQLRDRLRASFPELKVLFMSGYPDDIVATVGVLESGIHFLQKPFTIHTLASAIRRILDE